MDIDGFSNAHPIAYVHIAYAVVWLLQFGYVLWMVAQWRKAGQEEKATEPEQSSGPVVPRSHA